jgi:hypothetical protein
MSDPQLGHWSLLPWKRANLRRRFPQQGHSTRRPALAIEATRRKARLPASLYRDGTAALTAGTDSNCFIVLRPRQEGKRDMPAAFPVARVG